MKKIFVHKVTTGASRLRKASPYLLFAAVTVGLAGGNIAFATTTTLFETIVKALGGLAVAGAAIMAVMGVLAYAEAKSEGEGPAMSKAKNQITAAVMLAIVGIALSAGASTIAGTITDITF